ncbi:hypothetical protein A8L34_12610 [Bacillus sp. FJAT-27264]|uniref:DUF4387 domain-containing protein n=1 Tax=Paenibacillus sp. (strain DSM 101736 / FJAT-27264) TaxID=1850362 RepID=UPI000807EF2E|nr:DUF4387 domain-containing protein [Bacillus sp. FJAT-27264]OBZ14745.1 hypothetical protein A8L34_12610 [Bacillus sp. FJAT-27264]
MPKIDDVTKYVRSKNAGPFWITIDLFCETLDDYILLKDSPAISHENIGRLYHIKPDQVKIFHLANLNVVKISVPRLNPQGHRYERDMHSGQQYVQLLDLEL